MSFTIEEIDRMLAVMDSVIMWIRCWDQYAESYPHSELDLIIKSKLRGLKHDQTQ